MKRNEIIAAGRNAFEAYYAGRSDALTWEQLSPKIQQEWINKALEEKARKSAGRGSYCEEGAE